jgi:hypothetical protein
MPVKQTEHSLRDQGILDVYYNKLRDTFLNSACRRHNVVDRYYRIGELVFHWKSAGEVLDINLMPALEHLSIEDQPQPSLTILAWDSASTGTELPDPPFEFRDNYEYGAMWVGDTDRYKFLFQPDYGTVYFLDRLKKEAIFWYFNAYRLPYNESGAPLRILLSWWLGNNGYQLVHAGAVATAEGGVLLVGKGGSGKSTTAIACLESGMLYAADDYCVLNNNTTPYAHSLYSSGKLNPEDIERFPNLLPALSNYNSLQEEKALYFFNKHFPERVSTGFPIRAILIPKVSDFKKIRLAKVSPAKSLLALAPSTIFQLHGFKQPNLNMLGNFVKQLPSYRIELGTDISMIPGVIEEIISNN